MSFLDDINKVALDRIVPKLVEQAFKSSPVLDFMKRNELSYIYACAERYGYKSPYGKTPYLSNRGWR